MLKFARAFTLSRTSIYNQLISRTLYSSGALGLDAYIATRDKIKNQFLNNEVKFREKMKEYVEDKSGMIFTEDLRNMLHIANKDDIDLVIKMIEKFNSQNKELKFGNYVFGPVVMRMFYHLGEIDPALKCFLKSDFNEFFNQPASFHILFDMLYKNGNYEKILEIYDVMKSRPDHNLNAYKHIVTLTFAACYKINTSDSLKLCLEIWRELNEKGVKMMRKAATFLAGLALKQNSPHIALEIISTLREQQYLTIRNIKLQAYSELNRPEDVLPILRSILEIDDASMGPTKQTVIRDVINKIKESIQINHKKELENDFNRILKFLEDNGHITDQTMDDILCLEIATTNMNAPRRDQGYLAATFSRDKFNTRTRNHQPRRRQEGLQDLY